MLVQLPEPIYEERNGHALAAEFLKEIGRPCAISELTKERLRRASLKLGSSLTGADLGFRVFKLDSSNVRAWEPDRTNLRQAVFDHIDHLKPDRSEDDLFYELLLKFGFDLCAPAARRELAGKRVTVVAGGELVTCLSESIAASEVDELALGIAAWRGEMEAADDVTVVFRDSAFNDDVSKTNMTEILRQYGFKDVRSV